MAGLNNTRIAELFKFKINIYSNQEILNYNKKSCAQANQREESYKEQIKTLTTKLKQVQ